MLSNTDISQINLPLGSLMNRACICQSSVVVCVWRAKIKGNLLTYLLKMRISCSEVDRHESTQGEVTSQSLWSRYDRHFVGITRYNASVKWRRFIVLFKWNWINWVPKMSTWSTYQQNVFKRYHSDEHFSFFTYKMAAKINWHRYRTKLRHCHPMYS